MTIAAALTSAMRVVRSDSPRLDIEIIAADVLGKDRAWLAAHSNDTFPADRHRRFIALVQRRRQGTPVAYLLGRAPFIDFSLRVTAATLVPRPFTELLVHAWLAHISQRPDSVVVDVGTGSGAIALAIARRRRPGKIFATDISPAALHVARGNARRLQPATPIHWRRGSLLRPVARQRITDVIANLPYLTPQQTRHASLRAEPKLALDGGPGGLVLIRELLAQAKQLPNLRSMTLEFDPRQWPTIRSFIKRMWPNWTIEPIDDGQTIRGCLAFAKPPSV